MSTQWQTGGKTEPSHASAHLDYPDPITATALDGMAGVAFPVMRGDACVQDCLLNAGEG